VGAKNVKDITKFSTATGLPVILDESLCTMDDLLLFQNVPGLFIANIKISRVGGLVRALKMVAEVKNGDGRLLWVVMSGRHLC